MKKIINPQLKDWSELSKRPQLNQTDLTDLILNVFQDVQENGDRALKKFTKEFDQCELTEIAVSKKEFAASENLIRDDLKKAIQLAKANIEAFHLSQQTEKQIIETQPGVECWRESRGIENVGLYIPGGSAPLFSTILMLAIPAKIAGCKNIVLCTPPNSQGQIDPAILYTAKLTGVTSVFKTGGSQAIAAMAFGTESIPKVNKIFGPGNQYVTKAKELAQQFGIAIDMPAGPSEVLIVADDSSIPEFVAADLLSQAEHGPDSQVILLSTSEFMSDNILNELDAQLNELPRKEIAKKALWNSKTIILNDISQCIAFSNLYAPEHLILAFDNAEDYIPSITNAGSVFIGNYSCESAGDYASGTNHTLPTNGFAKNYSGVSLDSFVKKITFQKLTAEGINSIGPSIELMAEAEQLIAHKNAVTVRLNYLNS
ncbi:histidinol dehydrogenase [Parvicella tangerina]|uniref:Histidinol dehydrogenase n=1 Tax=Parvicella tangerina TaxID=2829795 RepID=A0A916JM42_9FLAO|nr:histidinol dehydrogenase [Parvicella tangerina]CAG5081343.1 Histidinol dehydrogenase [Parvicella tangerina]